MEDRISVIVPVYQVETYLDICVESIVNQTYQNLEILLIDDGSPDRCPAMCDAWAKKDPRIRVIHKENGGVSSARNRGMDEATGDYICFVDSDDWIDRRYMQLLLSAAKENAMQIAACRFCQPMPGETDRASLQGDPAITLYTAEQAMESLVCGGVFIGVVWDKLYAKDVIGDIRFREGRRHEDEFFVHSIFDRTNGIALVEAELYHYVQWETSFMRTAKLEHLDMFEAVLERVELVRLRYPGLYRKAKASVCVMCVSHYRQGLCADAAYPQQYFQQIKAYRRKVQFTPGELISYGIKDITYIICSRVCIHAFAWILNLRRGGIE